MATTVLDSPIGPLILHACGGALTRIGFGGAGAVGGRPADPVLAEAAGQFREYFAGERTLFELPTSPEGTAFERRVWVEVSRIPFGGTRTYAEIARSLGNAKGVRAVGRANGRNPLPIVVPCHRVIGADGSLTGYAGGLDRKAKLLAHEGALLTAGAG